MGAWRDWPPGVPMPLTALVGRVRELPVVTRLVSSGRLVTLVGTGGVGKTRLALEAAMAVSRRFDDAIDFVDLGAVADPATVPAAVAKALGIEERAGADVVERMAVVLRPQRRLLILDNCEHLRGICAALAIGLLSRCPGVVVLA